MECWTKEKWVCPESGDVEILAKAMRLFDPAYDAERGFGWAYERGGRGEPTYVLPWPAVPNPPLWYNADCIYLVNTTLKELGYHLMGETPGEQSPHMKFFCVKSMEEAEPGDIYYSYSHAGIIASQPWQVEGWIEKIEPDGTVVQTLEWGKYWTGTYFEATRRFGGSIGLHPWAYQPPVILRPKKLVYEVICEGVVMERLAADQRVDDPLLLDLDGNGIKTVGLSAGIHFDHDKNGHKELTGWVAPGDGMLMLDLNGNGRLDSGRELFGGDTVMPNGVKAANGFQALAYYDANADGKIDALDPVWSQLKVWQHNDVLLTPIGLDDGQDYATAASDTGQRYFVAQESSGCG